MKKKRKNKKNNKKFIFKLIFSICFIVGIISAIIFYFCKTDLFIIEQVNIEGNSIVKEESLYKYAKQYENQNGFEVMFGNISSFRGLVNAFALRDSLIEAKIVNDLAYIKNAKVNIAPPNKISISVVEREPLIVVKFIKNYVLADKEFVALEIIEDIEEGIYLENEDVNRVILGETIDISNEKREIYMRLFSYFVHKGKNLGNDILSIILENDIITIKLENNINAVLEVDEDFEYNFKFLNEIYYEQIDIIKNGTIYFNKGEDPVFTRNER